jgi:tRNA (mo5U34)-methyltransferase
MGICPMTADEIQRAVDSVKWFHRIDLGNGIVTPGIDMDGQAKIAFHKLPGDLAGETVLDIGAWDGLFSFEAKRRGATRVLATDEFVWHKCPGWSKDGFNLARRLLNLDIEDLDIDVMELTPQRVGRFDVVLFAGVLYHLRHPLLALEKVSAVTKEMLILGTWVDMVSHQQPAAAFYPHRELGDDATNWWGLNPSCIEAMLRDVGFNRIEPVSAMMGVPSPSSVSPFPMVFHAWKSDTVETKS